MKSNFGLVFLAFAPFFIKCLQRTDERFIQTSQNSLALVVLYAEITKHEML